MRKIAIIGSGQAGLLCAHGLLKGGNAVTLYSDKRPQAWLDESRPTGTAGRFDTSLQFERDLGLAHWEAEAPEVGGAHMIFCPSLGNRLATMTGRLTRPGAAIDLRLQSHRWMLDLLERGGSIEYGEVTIPRLDEIAQEHDLTLVATGKFGLASLFERDDSRCVYYGPQRNLAMVCITNVRLGFDGIPFLPFRFNALAPVGEAFWIPYHHKDVGPSWNCIFEAKAGGPMDRFQGAKTATMALEIAKSVVRELMPWDHEWIKDATMSDENGWLVGSVTPVVKKAAARLPSGRHVMAMGDTAMSVDPIAGQGANNGNRLAYYLVQSVAARGDRPLDAAWMQETFDTFWHAHGKYSNDWTKLLLEPASLATKLFLIAQYGSDGTEGRDDDRQALANAFADNFEFPGRLTPTFQSDPDIRAFIAEKTGSLFRSVARNVPGILRAQLRQRLGKDPAHPAAATAA